MKYTFVLRRQDWTDSAASIWGDMLDLDRPATYEEAQEDFDRHGVSFNPADYYNEDGSYKGPCVMGVSVETIAE